MENSSELLVVMAIAAWAGGAFFGVWLQRRKDGSSVGETGAGCSTDSLPSAADMEDRIDGLDKQLRMLAGRLNRVDPPARKDRKENSDEDAPGPTISEPLASSIVGNPRSQVLAAWRARRAR